MYDIDFYRLISDSQDEVLKRNFQLTQMKNHLAEMNTDESYTDKDRETLQNEISELYLAITYAQSLQAELSRIMPSVRMLASFVDSRFDDETFNMLYEEWIADDN